MEEKINLNINDGDSFFAHQASINFNPTMFFLDFKNITPRMDQRSQQSKATLVLKHNVVMLEPYHTLLLRDLFNKVIKDYEKEFGKIEKPDPIKLIEKKQKKQMKGKKVKKSKSNSKKETNIPNYFG